MGPQALLADPRPGHDEALLLLDVVFAFTAKRRSRLRLHGFNIMGQNGPHPLCHGETLPNTNEIGDANRYPVCFPVLK